MGATLSTISTIAGIAGTGMQIYGAISQGQQQKQAEDYNAQVARQQAEAYRNKLPIIEYQKEVVTEKGKLEEYRKRRAARFLRSEQVALYGKAGVQLTGSPLEVIIDSASQAELDIMIDKYNTRLDLYNLDIEAYNAEVGARRAESEAQYKSYLGKQYQREGYFKAAQTLLTSASGYAMKYGGTRTTGINTSAEVSKIAAKGGTGYTVPASLYS